MDLVNTGLQPALCDHELPFKQPPMALHPFLLCQVRSPRRQGYTKAFQVTGKCSRSRKYLEAKGENYMAGENSWVKYKIILTYQVLTNFLE